MQVSTFSSVLINRFHCIPVCIDWVGITVRSEATYSALCVSLFATVICNYACMCVSACMCMEYNSNRIINAIRIP